MNIKWQLKVENHFIRESTVRVMITMMMLDYEDDEDDDEDDDDTNDYCTPPQMFKDQLSKILLSCIEVK